MKPEPKYKVGEIVKVCSWTRDTIQEIQGIDWIYHPRMEEYSWGYSFSEPTGLSFHFVPEGYLRKIEENNE